MATILKKGSKGEEVKDLQRKLGISVDGIFGSGTEQAVKNFQSKNGLTADGIVGNKTWAKLNGTSGTTSGTSKPSSSSGKYDEKYKDVVIQGSTFPDKPYQNNLQIKLNTEIVNEYIPTFQKVLPTAPKGLRLLLTIMAYHEGFKQGSRSYRTNNPGNIGNVDSGANKSIATLGDGILLQKSYIDNIVAGKNKSYPMNQQVNIKPYYSEEIAKNSATYGMSPWLPGYGFVFTGQIDQFVKIYSTGARAGNSYINTIVSYFNSNGLVIKPESKIQDIIVLQ
jgi:hypothetical protein